jgi:hypothetical protein
MPKFSTSASAPRSRKNSPPRFGGDPSSADWRHFGRLAGFTNQKPSRRLPSGLAPFVLLREAAGEIFTLSAEIVDTVKRRLAEETWHAKTHTATARSSGPDELPPIEELHRDPRYGGDLHRADIAWANMAAAAGPQLGDHSRHHPERARARPQGQPKTATGVRCQDRRKGDARSEPRE